MKQEQRLQMLSKSFPCKSEPLTEGVEGHAYGFFFGGDPLERVRISVERCFATRYVKYDFKPSSISNSTYKVFGDVTSIFGGASLFQTMKHGVATYVEVAADYVGLKTTDHLYFLPYARATPHGSKKVGTTYYLGSATSDLCICIYDRAAHPDATYAEKAKGQLLRIEAQLRGKTIHVPPLQLVHLFNPFTKLRVCEPDTLFKLVAGKPQVIQLLHKCREIGSPHAFATKPLKFKKMVMEAAKANQAWWWKPGDLMQGWEKTVQEQLRFQMLGLVST